MCTHSPYHSPTVSHTLPAGVVHPRPTLETNSNRKLLKRYSSAGPETLHLPPPDYADLGGKDDHEQTPSADAIGPSGLEVFVLHLINIYVILTKYGSVTSHWFPG